MTKVAVAETTIQKEAIAIKAHVASAEGIAADTVTGVARARPEAAVRSRLEERTLSAVTCCRQEQLFPIGTGQHIAFHAIYRLA